MRPHRLIPTSGPFERLAGGARFRDQIAIPVHASAPAIFDALSVVSLRDMKLAWALGEIRYLPSRLAGKMPEPAPARPFLQMLVDEGTLVLHDDRPRELILGSAGQLHRVNQTPRRFTSCEDFDRFDDPNYEKLFITIRVVPTGQPETNWLVLDHATRALSPAAARKFARYWRLVRPLGGFASRQLLRAVQREAESAKPGGSMRNPPPINGRTSGGFEPVRQAFTNNFTERGELGGACAIYHHGEKVVDIWGGTRNKVTGDPWLEDTMVLVHSATKGLAAMTLAVAHSRGWLDYEARVADYWPEFAQAGKDRITVRQLLAHQAGLFALDEDIDRAVIADPDRLAAIIARQKPRWAPGTRQAYHGITLGYYEGELLRRIDPEHRTLGQFFQDEIAGPLGLDVYIRLPEAVPNSRLAAIARPALIDMLRGFGPKFMVVAMNPRSNINRALRGSELPHDELRVYARNLEIPSGGAVGTARAIAHAYSVFATGGKELGLRRETLDLLAAPAVPPTRGFYDECLKGDGVMFSLGFMKPSRVWPFGGPNSFGSPGAGGALGYADPDAGIGYAYVTSQMGTTLTGDPRDVALRDALEAALHPAPAGLDKRVA